MSISSLFAALADEYAWHRLLIRPDPVAREAHGPLSPAVDHEHTRSLPFRDHAKAHGVSRQKRAKPPCLILWKPTGRIVTQRARGGEVTAALADTPRQGRRSERGPNVAQQWPTLGSPAIAAVPATSPPAPGTVPARRDAHREVAIPCSRSPGGSGRFMLPPSGVPPQSPRRSARRLPAWPFCRTTFASAGSRRQRTSDRVPIRNRRAR
jgi:hypothetical protein